MLKSRFIFDSADWENGRHDTYPPQPSRAMGGMVAVWSCNLHQPTLQPKLGRSTFSPWPSAVRGCDTTLWVYQWWDTPPPPLQKRVINASQCCGFGSKLDPRIQQICGSGSVFRLRRIRISKTDPHRYTDKLKAKRVRSMTKIPHLGT